MRSAVSWLSGLWSGAAEWFRDMERRHALREDLHALDDRLLDDIGLRREDIECVVAGARQRGNPGLCKPRPVGAGVCPWCGRPFARPCP